MSSSFRRLQGLFSSKSSAAKSATAKATNSITPPPKPTAAKPATTSITTPTPDEPKPAIKTRKQIINKLKHLVRNFKKNSNSDQFRRAVYNYESTVRRLAAAGQHPLIQDILEHQKNFKDITNERFVVRLISLYGKAGMFDNANKLFDEMPELKCERTVMSFNALLAACVNAKKFDKFEELFLELPDKLGIQPDIVTYNTVIKAFCHMASLDSASQVVQLMESNGIEPNVITFNTLIDAYYRENRVDEGDKLWGVMESKNVVPDVRSYNPKLRVLVTDKRISEAVELMEEMKSKGVKPDVYSFNGLIKGFCDDKNLEEAKRWYGEITKNEVVPDRATFDILIPFVCDMADFEFALELCKEVINLKHRVSIVSMQRVVDGLVKELKVDEAQKLVDSVNLKNYFHYRLKISADM